MDDGITGGTPLKSFLKALQQSGGDETRGVELQQGLFNKQHDAIRRDDEKGIEDYLKVSASLDGNEVRRYENIFGIFKRVVFPPAEAEILEAAKKKPVDDSSKLDILLDRLKKGGAGGSGGGGGGRGDDGFGLIEAYFGTRILGMLGRAGAAFARVAGPALVKFGGPIAAAIGTALVSYFVTDWLNEKAGRPLERLYDWMNDKQRKAHERADETVRKAGGRQNLKIREEVYGKGAVVADNSVRGYKFTEEKYDIRAQGGTNKLEERAKALKEEAPDSINMESFEELRRVNRELSKKQMEAAKLLNSYHGDAGEMAAIKALNDREMQRLKKSKAVLEKRVVDDIEAGERAVSGASEVGNTEKSDEILKLHREVTALKKQQHALEDLKRTNPVVKEGFWSDTRFSDVPLAVKENKRATQQVTRQLEAKERQLEVRLVPVERESRAIKEVTAAASNSSFVPGASFTSELPGTAKTKVIYEELQKVRVEKSTLESDKKTDSQEYKDVILYEKKLQSDLTEHLGKTSKVITTPQVKQIARGPSGVVSPDATTGAIYKQTEQSAPKLPGEKIILKGTKEKPIPVYIPADIIKNAKTFKSQFTHGGTKGSVTIDGRQYGPDTDEFLAVWRKGKFDELKDKAEDKRLFSGSSPEEYQKFLRARLTPWGGGNAPSPLTAGAAQRLQRGINQTNNAPSILEMGNAITRDHKAQQTPQVKQLKPSSNNIEVRSLPQGKRGTTGDLLPPINNTTSSIKNYDFSVGNDLLAAAIQAPVGSPEDIKNQFKEPRTPQAKQIKRAERTDTQRARDELDRVGFITPAYLGKGPGVATLVDAAMAQINQQRAARGELPLDSTKKLTPREFRIRANEYLSRQTQQALAPEQRAVFARQFEQKAATLPTVKGPLRKPNKDRQQLLQQAVKLRDVENYNAYTKVTSKGETQVLTKPTQVLKDIKQNVAEVNNGTLPQTPQAKQIARQSSDIVISQTAKQTISKEEIEAIVKKIKYHEEEAAEELEFFGDDWESRISARKHKDEANQLRNRLKQAPVEAAALNQARKSLSLPTVPQTPQVTTPHTPQAKQIAKHGTVEMPKYPDIPLSAIEGNTAAIDAYFTLTDAWDHAYQADKGTTKLLRIQDYNEHLKAFSSKLPEISNKYLNTSQTPQVTTPQAILNTEESRSMRGPSILERTGNGQTPSLKKAEVKLPAAYHLIPGKAVKFGGKEYGVDTPEYKAAAGVETRVKQARMSRLNKHVSTSPVVTSIQSKLKPEVKPRSRVANVYNASGFYSPYKGRRSLSNVDNREANKTPGAAQPWQKTYSVSKDTSQYATNNIYKQEASKSDTGIATMSGLLNKHYTEIKDINAQLYTAAIDQVELLRIIANNTSTNGGPGNTTIIQSQQTPRAKRAKSINIRDNFLTS